MKKKDFTAQNMTGMFWQVLTSSTGQHKRVNTSISIYLVYFHPSLHPCGRCSSSRRIPRYGFEWQPLPVLACPVTSDPFASVLLHAARRLKAFCLYAASEPQSQCLVFTMQPPTASAPSPGLFLWAVRSFQVVFWRSAAAREAVGSGSV